MNFSYKNVLNQSINNLKLLTVSSLLLCSSQCLAQNQQIQLPNKNITIKELFNQIKKQTQFSIDYNQKNVSNIIQKKVNVGNGSVNSVLERALKGTGLSFSFNGNQIVISLQSPNKNLKFDSTKQMAGRIVDIKGEPIIGATIMEKGTTNGVISDFEGNFIINVPENAIIEVSYIGYHPQQLVADEKLLTNIILKEDAEVLDEVVVVGYTSQKKGLLTGAVATMKVDDNMKNIPTTSASNLLVGKLAGVNVGTASGVPGTNPNISIRTGSSWNSQSITYVIDGVVKSASDFNALSPNEIDNISVLKDAASAAVYGSRSAGGVIVVTTKRGEEGKPIFNYSYGYSIDARTKNSDLTNAVQTAEIYNRLETDAAGWKWSKEEIDYIKNVNNGWGYDHLEAVWLNPVTQSHNLSVNGGNDRIKYFGATSYVKQDGFLSPLKYDKFNFRMNITANISKNFEIFSGLSLSNSNKSNVVYNDPDFLYQKLRVWKPDEPVYTNNGQFIGNDWVGNIGAFVTDAGGYNKNNYLRPQILVKGTYKAPFIKGLSASVSFSKSWYNTITNEFYKNYDMVITKKDGDHGHIVSVDDSDIVGVKKSTFVTKDHINKTSQWSNDMQLNFQISYDRIFNNLHHVTGTFVTEWNEGSGAGVYGGRETFPLYTTDQFWAASDARLDTWGGGDTSWKNGRMSYIGQFGYTYDNKYLFNFSFREDGSMKFAPNKRWGFFPAVSAGWIVSEEKFFNQNLVQYLKLRGSVGLTGNDAVGGWQWQQSYKAGSSAFFGVDPNKNVGLTYGNIVNPNLTWEKDLTYDIGVDITFLKSWNLAFDYWYRNSYDILGNRQNSLPTTFSQTMPAENYGKIHAQGIDFSLSYKGTSKDFTYYGNLTLSYGWNKVVKKDYAENAQWIDIPVGKSTSYVVGYEFDQILKTQDQLNAFIEANPNYSHNGLKPELGMMVFKDKSGPNGVPDGIIDGWDRIILKNNNFPVVMGLNLGGSWKGLSLDMMFSGKLGITKSFQDLAEGGAAEWQRMWTEWYGNSWTPDNTDAYLPQRKGLSTPKTYNTACSYWMDNGSFLRLKYLTLSYDLPKNQFYNKVFNNIRLFFTGTNLFVISKFNKYYDPEIGHGNAFPILKSFNFGVDVTF